MSLRIAVDLDGTVADMDGALQREAERLFGPGVDLRASLRSRPEGAPDAEADSASAPADPRTAAMPANVTRPSNRQYRQLWARVREIENFWLSLQEIEPGAVARLAAAAAEHRWQVIFLTQRPSTVGDTAQVQSQRWLQAHGFELPSVYVVLGSRGKVADALALDAVVDDRPENCLDVITDSNATSILVWRDTPESAPPGAGRLGIRIVHSMAEAVAQLAGRAVEPSRGVVGRLRETLGI